MVPTPFAVASLVFDTWRDDFETKPLKRKKNGAKHNNRLKCVEVTNAIKNLSNKLNFGVLLQNNFHGDKKCSRVFSFFLRIFFYVVVVIVVVFRSFFFSLHPHKALQRFHTFRINAYENNIMLSLLQLD